MCAATRSAWASGTLRNQSRIRERKRELALIRRGMLPFQRVQASMRSKLRVSEKEMPLFKS